MGLRGMRESDGNEGSGVAEGMTEAAGLGTLRRHEETDDVNTQKEYWLWYLSCDEFKVSQTIKKFSYQGEKLLNQDSRP